MTNRNIIQHGTQTKCLGVVIGRCSFDSQHWVFARHPANVGCFSFRYTNNSSLLTSFGSFCLLLLIDSSVHIYMYISIYTRRYFKILLILISSNKISSPFFNIRSIYLSLVCECTYVRIYIILFIEMNNKYKTFIDLKFSSTYMM